MKFTESEDGCDRCTIVLRVRLTRGQWDAIRKIADADDCSPRLLCEQIAGAAIRSEAEGENE